MSFIGDWSNLAGAKYWIGESRMLWNTYFGQRGENINIDLIADDSAADIQIYLDPNGILGEAWNLGAGWGEIHYNPNGLAGISDINHLYFLGAHELGHMVGLGNQQAGCMGGIMMNFWSGGPGNPGNIDLGCSDVNILNTMYRGDSSPVILDLTGDGIALSSAPTGVFFDIRSDGTLTKTAWTLSPDDAFLVVDLNNNGVVDNSAEMFGNYTLLENGERAAHGYEALAEYDENGDGFIDRADRVFRKLKVWSDNQRDGITQPGELRSLASVTVSRISLRCWDPGYVDFWGNWFALASRVQMTSLPGVTIAVDVFLQTDDR